MEATKVIGTYIAFATAPDKTADDNLAGDNGLFTGELVQALKVPGLSLDEVFNLVRARVNELSSGAQVPWSSSSVIGAFAFRDRSQAEVALETLRMEAARLERQLAEIDKRQSEVRGRQEAAAQSAERERQDWAVRLEKLKQERTQRELELQKAMEAERRRSAEELVKREQDLARQQAETRAAIQELRARTQKETRTLESITLTEARKRVAEARAEMNSRQNAIIALRDKELAQIDVTYSALGRQFGQPLTRDMFETSAQFEERQAAKRRELMDLSRRRDQARNDRSFYYAQEIAAQTKPFRERINDLVNRRYPAETLSAVWKDYDADHNGLTVAAGALIYRFEVPPAKAKELYSLRDQLKVDSTYRYSEDDVSLVREDVTLADPAGRRFARLPESSTLPALPHASAAVGTPGRSAEGLASLAEELLASSRFTEFEATASEALSRGATIRFVVQHHHSLNALHPITLSVSKTMITFSVIGAGLSEADRIDADDPPHRCDLDRYSTRVVIYLTQVAAPAKVFSGPAQTLTGSRLEGRSRSGRERPAGNSRDSHTGPQKGVYLSQVNNQLDES